MKRFYAFIGTTSDISIILELDTAQKSSLRLPDWRSLRSPDRYNMLKHPNRISGRSPALQEHITTAKIG